MFNFHPCNLNQKQKFDIISDINFLFDTGDWYSERGTPRYQTKPNLLKNTGLHWQHLNNNLLDGIKAFYNISPSKIDCWSYKSFPFVASDYSDKSWHNHVRFTPECRVFATAILYLHLPKKCNGTEYITEFNTVEFMPLIENTWIFFPVDLVHRPGYWDHENMKESRMVLAATAYI